MRVLKGLWFFYKKLVIPSLTISTLLSLFSMAYVTLPIGIILSYVVFTPCVHYFSYDIRSPNEYYFYHNLGLSKTALWANTITVSILLSFVLLAL
jgi:hypothetical protein